MTTSGDLGNNGILYIDRYGSGGSTLSIGGTLVNSNTTSVGSSSMSSPSTLMAATLQNSGTIYLTGSAGAQAVLELGSGLSSNSEDITVSNASVTTSGGFNNDGFLGVVGGSALRIGGMLTNGSQGNVILGSSSISSPVTLTVNGLNNAGDITIQGNAATSGEASLIVNGAVNNAGLVSIGSAANLTVNGASNAYTQTGGETSINGGTLSASNVSITGGFMVAGSGGTINGNLLNAGLVQVGESTNPVSVLNVNSYAQTSTGELWLFLTGRASSSLMINGSATLGGELVLWLSAGNVDPGDTFDIMSFSSELGDFSSLSLFNGGACTSGGTDIWNCLGSSLVFEEVFQPNDLLLVDISGTWVGPPVPEPSSLALLASGLFGLLFMARYRRA